MSSALHQLNIRVQALEGTVDVLSNLCGNLIDTNKAVQGKIKEIELNLATLLERNQ